MDTICYFLAETLAVSRQKEITNQILKLYAELVFNLSFLKSYLYVFFFQFEISKHFMARVLCLIMVPIIVYLFWFAIHFKLLPNT